MPSTPVPPARWPRSTWPKATRWRRDASWWWSRPTTTPIGRLTETRGRHERATADRQLLGLLRGPTVRGAGDGRRGSDRRPDRRLAGRADHAHPVEGHAARCLAWVGAR